MRDRGTTTTGMISDTPPADLELAALARRTTDAACHAYPGSLVRVDGFLTGGASSLTYHGVLRSGGTEQPIVLKVAPPRLPPVRNRDVLRQARLLERLYTLGTVRVPQVLFHAEASGDWPPFFAMVRLEGDSYEPVMDAGPPPCRPDELRSRALLAATQLAALHRTNLHAAGADSESVISLAGEVGRWRVAFETVPADLACGAADVAGALLATMPTPLGPCVVHGDYRLGNMLAVAGDVLGIIDWEIWAVSDPRVDLVRLATLVDRHGHPLAHDPPEGMASAAELVDAYVAAGGPDPGSLLWFDALNRFKTAATSALIVKNNRKRAQPDERSERFAPTIPELLSAARERLDAVATAVPGRPAPGI